MAADTGNWGVTSGPRIEWLYIAVTENYASPEALLNGPLTNETVTGAARPVRQKGRQRHTPRPPQPSRPSAPETSAPKAGEKE